MAAEVKHFAARVPKLTLILKRNPRIFGECERNVPKRFVMNSI